MEGKTISVLGSTGSIGVQTLDVAANLGISVTALAAGKNDRLMEEQVRRFRPAFAVMSDEEAASRLKLAVADTETRVACGETAIEEAASMADTAVSAITGIAGLRPTLAAIRAGRTVALANKESLVCAGEIVLAEAAARGVRILPVDSEHSAIFQCLQGRGDAQALRRVWLTASGGPFFGKTKNDLEKVSPADALKHPNWHMGAKITIDSATMMNKGLEKIEAMHLYGLRADQVEILIHRESIVHSMVEFDDGAILAQLSMPDMRLPIQYALTWPERAPSPVAPLRLAEVGKLTFYPPDADTFPCLELADRAVAQGGCSCARLNGANEEAVALFLAGKIGFYEIPDLISRAMEQKKCRRIPTLEEIFEADAQARESVRRSFAKISSIR